ncbi:hypothetical protein [Chryseolinea sp. H1M3-3]|uniref:hypothetical protein n=1 Tax=Chryseolinea sp. H1M3-3 TaxID=3034144 RepID=UPI0023EC0BA5|nr:hypothetical protein [Chryseolinea sp. H1M3-3]
MKKIFISACSVAMLCVFSFANAQTQDTTLAKVDFETNKEKGKVRNRAATQLDKTVTDEKLDLPANEKFVVPFNALDKKSNYYLLKNKVGPNGEELLQEGDGLYYMDVSGNKVKVKASELKEKAKHS